MEARRVSFTAIGTQWTVEVNDVLSDAKWERLQSSIHEKIAAFDKVFSRFQPDSQVTAMGKKAGSYKLPPEGYKLLKFYETLYAVTDGLVTPLIGQVMADTGYDAEYSLEEKPLSRPPRWEEVISYDAGQLILKQPALLDFGAAGKGCLVDIVAACIDASGAKEYTVNASGDLLHRGADLSVGLENPKDTTQVIGIAQLGNQSLCASAVTRRVWGKHHHVMNPQTLASQSGTLAAWVIADNTMVADGLATALFFASAQALRERFDFSYAVLRNDMNLERSKDFPATIYEAEAYEQNR